MLTVVYVITFQMSQLIKITKWKSPVIVFIRLMFSLSVWPKVIPLSGFYCISHDYIKNCRVWRWILICNKTLNPKEMPVRSKVRSSLAWSKLTEIQIRYQFIKVDPLVNTSKFFDLAQVQFHFWLLITNEWIIASHIIRQTRWLDDELSL